MAHISQNIVVYFGFTDGEKVVEKRNGKFIFLSHPA
jgi:hypothetical protein